MTGQTKAGENKTPSLFSSGPNAPTNIPAFPSPQFHNEKTFKKTKKLQDQPTSIRIKRKSKGELISKFNLIKN